MSFKLRPLYDLEWSTQYPFTLGPRPGGPQVGLNVVAKNDITGSGRIPVGLRPRGSPAQSVRAVPFVLALLWRQEMMFRPLHPNIFFSQLIFSESRYVKMRFMLIQVIRSEM
jgi:hypothetical protein